MPVWFMGVVGPYVPLVWQVAQGCVVGMWFAGMPPVAVAKPPGTVVLVWQVEQSAVVTMWPVFFGIGVTPWNAVPLWHWAQFEVIPVWTIAVPEKSVVLLWQVPQSCVVGMWLLAQATGTMFWKD